MRKIGWFTLLIPVLVAGCAHEKSASGDGAGPAATVETAPGAPAYQSGKMHIHDPNDPSHSPGKHYEGGSAGSIEPGKQHVHDPADPSHSPGKNFSPEQVPDAAADAKTFFTCPMHPEIHKAAIGNCPICGMRLVTKTIP